MARIFEPEQCQIDGWNDWLSTRPKVIQEIGKRLDPWTLYRLRPNGQRVTVRSFSEDGTVTVLVSGQFNFVMMEREVFGINPNDLEECDLPSPDELTGSLDLPVEVVRQMMPTQE